MRVNIAVGRAAAMASGVKSALGPRTGIHGWGAKKRERRMIPDSGIGIREYVPEQKLPPVEKEVARIYGPVRHDAEFRCSRGTADKTKLRIRVDIRQKSRAEHRADLRGIELQDSTEKAVKGDGIRQ